MTGKIKKQVEAMIDGFYLRGTNIDAITSILGNPEDKRHEPVKQSLVDIVNGVHPLFLGHVKDVATCLDHIPKSGAEGPSRIVVMADTGREQKIDSIKLLAHLSSYDNSVHSALWRAAKGETTQITNIEYAATDALSTGAFPTRKEELKKIALDPMRKEADRVLAYKIFAGARMFTDQEIYRFVCGIASNSSIADLYRKGGVLAPSAASIYSNYPLDKCMAARFGTGNGWKSAPDLKGEAAKEADKEFQEDLFKIVSYVLEVTPADVLNKNVRAMNQFKKGYPITSQDLTLEICRLIMENPSYHVNAVCNYAAKMEGICEEEAKHLRETLGVVRPYFVKMNNTTELSNIDWATRMVNQRLNGMPKTYIVDKRLSLIWGGHQAAKQPTHL